MSLNGEPVQLTPEGALFLPACRTLVVADLHFEKGSAMAVRGRRLAPPYDTTATLDRLQRLMHRMQPTSVIALGDSFHDGAGPFRLANAEARRIQAMTKAVDWVWIAGNHDPDPPAALGGTAAAELLAGKLLFRHEPRSGPRPGEVAGHLHPKAAVSTTARRISGFCFVTDGQRIILPAFGAYTGGLDVHAPAIRSLFKRGLKVFMLGRERLYQFPMSRLSKPRSASAPVDNLKL
jgi:DNA ligase-associated metallophosphoesterase